MGLEGKETTAGKKTGRRNRIENPQNVLQVFQKPFLRQNIAPLSMKSVKIHLNSLWIETPRITCLKIQCTCKCITTVLKKKRKQISFTLRRIKNVCPTFAYLREVLKILSTCTNSEDCYMYCTSSVIVKVR